MQDQSNMNDEEYQERLARRFWAKVAIGSANGCWDWQAGTFASGYGAFGIDGQPHYAHRVAWELTRGSIPAGLYVLHRCDRRICCNASAHLFLGTSAENSLDMAAKGRGRSFVLIPEQVLDIRALYATGEWTLTMLGERFDVSEGTILSVVKRKTWAHI